MRRSLPERAECEVCHIQTVQSKSALLRERHAQAEEQPFVALSRATAAPAAPGMSRRPARVPRSAAARSSVSPSRSATVRTSSSRSTDGGAAASTRAHALVALVAAAARTRARAAPGRSDTARPPDPAPARTRPGRRRPCRPGRARRAAAPPAPPSPAPASSMPRSDAAWPAASASKASSTVEHNARSSDTWRSVSAVPIEATRADPGLVQQRAHRCSPPPRSPAPAGDRCRGHGRVRRGSRSWGTAAPSGEFRYFGGSPPGIWRAPNPRTRPRTSASGNISRSRNLSTGPRRPLPPARPASSSSAVNPLPAAAAHTGPRRSGCSRPGTPAPSRR